MGCGKDVGSSSGQMVRYMRDTGKMTKQMDEDDLFIPMAICMKEIGLMIRPMDLGYIFMLTSRSM
jgi:hypothetical protein